MSGSGGNPNKLTVKQIEKRSTKQTGYWVKGQTEKQANGLSIFHRCFTSWVHLRIFLRLK